MSKALMNSALGGVAIAGGLAVALATGVIQWPTDAEAPVVADAPDAPTGPVAGATTGTVPEAAVADAVSDAALETGTGTEVTASASETVSESAAPSTEAVIAPSTQTTAPADPEAPVLALRVMPGSSVLATGSSAPGDTVEVLFNGEPVAQTQTEDDGSYATVIDIPETGPTLLVRARVMRDGTERLSADEFIVPSRAPAQVASVAPSAPDAPEAGSQPAGTVAVDGAPQRGTALASVDAPTADGGALAVPRPSASASGDSPAAPATAEAPRTAEVGDAPTAQGAPAALSAGAEGTAPRIETSSAAPVAPRVDSGAPESPQVASAQTVPEATENAPRTDTGTPEVANAPEAPRGAGILVAGPDGVEALDKAPLSPGDVALDSISYDTEGTVLLAGRGTEDAFVRLYLDNRPLTTSRVQADGNWRVDLPQVDTGTYTLRVDQVNAAGDVVARVESPFLREDPEVLERLSQDGGPISEITVQPGHSLWKISQDRYGNGIEYVKIFRANRDRIRNPDLIYPGQIFDLPEEAAAQPATE